MAAFVLLPVSSFGQTAAPKPSVVTGDVVSVADTKIVVQTKDGPLDLLLSGSTEFKRVPPENPSLRSAVASNLSEIGVGDKIMATGILGEDKKVLPARAVYLMTKSDIAQKSAKDRERWTTRGIAGRVAAVNTQTGQISVEVRGLMNTTTVVVTPKSEVVVKRYAPNSVQYDKAVASSVTEIQVGDMLRAVGDRSQDGAAFAAEEIVTGAFRTVAGTVKSVDAEKNQVVVTDLQTEKDVTVDLGAASVMKKFPEEMAQRMAMFQGGMRPGGPGAPQGGAPPQSTPGQGGPPAGGPGRMMGGRGSIDDMLERFPNVTVADLKPGDQIAVSSTRTQNLDHITAIKLLAGIGPFLQAAQMQAAAAGQRGGQRSLSLEIPGLDGFGGP